MRGKQVKAVMGVTAAVLVATAAASSHSDSPIADAAMLHDADSVRSLVEHGADVNAAQGDGMTALHWVANHGDAELAQVLIAAGANVEAVTRIGSYAPLHLASKAGHSTVSQALLDAGANPNAVTTTGAATPLHFAAGAGSAETVQLLLDHGADVNAAESAWGQTPLIFAAEYNRVDALQVLLEHGADVAVSTKVIDLPTWDAVDKAAEERRTEILEAFHSQKEEAEAQSWTPSPSQVQSAVHAAQEIQRSGESGKAEADEPDPTGGEEVTGFSGLVGAWGGLTPLLHAVREGHVESTRALLDAGADVNQVSVGDHTSPLLIATVNGHFDLAMFLLERGADPRLAGDNGVAPLFAAINAYWAPKSRYPQQHAYMLQKATYLDLMKALLEAGADPNVRLKKHVWYMSYTFDLLDVDTRGATPFWRAAYATDVDAMRLLVQAGADPNVPTMKPPERRGRGGRGGGRAGDAAEEEEDPSGLPPVPADGPAVWPIHAASGVGYGEGYAANAHRHVPDGWLPAVKYLVEELGADVNARDHNGYNPVHHAAARGDNELIVYLVEKGADVTAVSRRGQTTADMANGPVQRISPFPGTVALLEELGSKNNHRCMSC